MLRAEPAWRIAAGIVLAVALAARLAWLQAPHPLQPDSLEYIQLARSLSTIGVYSADGATPSSYRPPLYPLTLAAAQALTTRWETLMLVAQSLLGTLTVFLTLETGRRLLGARPALAAGALLAIAPMTGHFASLLLTETLFTCLVMSAVFTWTLERPLIAGVLFGAAALTRASLLPYLVLLGAAGLAPAWPGRRACRTIAAAALLTVAPWVVRNGLATGHWTVADAGWGTNLLIGTVDLQRGSNRWAQIETALGDVRGIPGAAAETMAAERAIAIIREDPLKWIAVRARQWVWLFVDAGDYLPVASNRFSFRQALDERRADTIVLKAGFAAGTAALALLACYGAWTLRRRAVELVPLWSFPLYLAAAHAAVFVEPRYGLPLVPFLTLFAAAAVVPSADPVAAAMASHSGVEAGGLARRLPA